MKGLIKLKEYFRNFYRILTPFGWFLFFTLIIVPFVLGFVGGYTAQDQLIKLQSKTNGMEHTDNYRQLHKAELQMEGGKADDY